MLPILVQEAGSEEAALASAQEALAGFEPQFEAARIAGMRRKLGFITKHEADAELIEELLKRMETNKADFTLTFRGLCDAAGGPEGDDQVRSLFSNPDAYDAWAVRWRMRLDKEPDSAEGRTAAMRAVNPAYIPRNHVVEAALEAAVWRQDLKPFEELVQVLALPYEDRPGLERYAAPARPEEYVSRTFCGT